MCPAASHKPHEANGLVATPDFVTRAWTCPTAQAASFNCDKAETADEKAICADRELNDEDVEMTSSTRSLSPT